MNREPEGRNRRQRTTNENTKMDTDTESKNKGTPRQKYRSMVTETLTYLDSEAYWDRIEVRDRERRGD